jgi:hypothetical protein
MAGSAYQGVLITCVKSAIDNVNNTAADFLTDGYICNWYTPVVKLDNIEPFRDKGTTTATVTFKEQKIDTNTDTMKVRIVYELYTSS